MSEEDGRDDDEVKEPAPGQDRGGAAPETKRRFPFAPLVALPAYLISIFLILVAPSLALMARLWRRIPKAPFFAAVAAISAIGWVWSWTVSRNAWWTFGGRYMLGWEVVRHLPLEEFLFYPFGGMLCILVYIAGYSGEKKRNPGVYWTFMCVGTAAFGAIAWATRSHGPYYLYSQFVVYNLVCGFLLSPVAAGAIDMRALGWPVALLGFAGYWWDYVAFTYGWWDYHAITRIKLSIVPIDDFNFFLFAPAAAVSVYHAMCRAMGASPAHD